MSLALRDNRTIRGAYIDRITQKFSLRVAEDGFMPHLGRAGGAVRQTIAGITTTSLDVTPGVTAHLPTGATVTFSWADRASAGAGIRTRSTGGVLSVAPPLLRGGGGVDVTLAPIRSARLGERANRLRFKATVSATIGQVIYAYRDLLRAQRAMALAQAAVRRAEEILDINRALVEAGRMPAVDIVQSEADLENQRLGVLGATRSLGPDPRSGDRRTPLAPGPAWCRTAAGHRDPLGSSGRRYRDPAVKQPSRCLGLLAG